MSYSDLKHSIGGRMIKEDNSVINVADLFDMISIYMTSVTGNNIDGTYGAFITETVQEASVERGLAYKAQIYNPSLASSATDTYLIRTPENRQITLGFESFSSIDTSVGQDCLLDSSLYEGATISSVGTDTNVLVKNLNRNWTGSQDFEVKYNPTITNNGDLLMKRLSSPSISTETKLTYQLKPNTDYILIINNIGGATANYVYTTRIYNLPFA